MTRILQLRKMRHQTWGASPHLLFAAGDNPHRLKNEAPFAHLCGVAPLRASSGNVNRHRLNRGGNRQANHARWRIVFTRMSTLTRVARHWCVRTPETTP